MKAGGKNGTWTKLSGVMKTETLECSSKVALEASNILTFNIWPFKKKIGEGNLQLQGNTCEKYDDVRYQQ